MVNFVVQTIILTMSKNNESRTETGDKFYLEFENEILGINVFKSHVNNTTIRIEIYQESQNIKNDKLRQ